jgi:transposase
MTAKITLDQAKQWRRDYESGMSLAALEKREGWSQPVIKRWILGAGGTIRPKGWNQTGKPPASASTIEEVVMLRRGGLRYKAIAARTGMTVNRCILLVGRWRSRAGAVHL